MKLLVIRDRHDFAENLRDQLKAREEDISVVPVAYDAIGDTVDLPRLVEQQSPDYLIFASFLPPEPSKATQKRFRNAIDQLERCSRKLGLPLIFLSSASVFDGSKLGYHEEDEYSAVSDRGRLYAEIEAQISKKLRKHIILRTSWIYSYHGQNFMTAVISHAAEDRTIQFNSAGKGCPTSLNDLARVLIAMLLQIDLGAENWGVYHYASSDACLGYHFVEAVLAQASQYNADINHKHLKFEHHDEVGGLFFFEPVVLKCQKLLDAFGIHQKPWRSLLSQSVRHYFEAQVEVE